MFVLSYVVVKFTNDYNQDVSKGLFLICVLVFGIFIFKSIITMKDTPFYEFDEAHRAETAKRMKEHGSFLIPLSGSPFDRDIDLKIASKDNPFTYLYYHLERPPMVYLLMIISASILGSHELSYRLPSFLLGMSIFVIYYFFAKKMQVSLNLYALSLGFLALLTSSDLWLSSQYAQLDTGIVAFLFLSLLLLIFYCTKKKKIALYLAGLSFGLAILSKGQPAVILLTPLTFLFFQKKLSLKEFFIFFTSALFILIPWFFNITLNFGVVKFIQNFFGFAFSSASISDIHQKAPLFWYARWFWESLRPGWTLFLALLFLDIWQRNFNWKKVTLALYVMGGLVMFSLPTNKIWWYVLSLVPAIAFYIYLSVSDYLKSGNGRMIYLALAVIISSLPIFLSASNKAVLLYAAIILACTIFALKMNRLKKVERFGQELFMLSLIFSMLWFYQRFPKIVPYHWETKPVAQYFTRLSGPKCLWVKGMPVEEILFYSNAGEAKLLDQNTYLDGHCKNYLIFHKKRMGEFEGLLKGKRVLFQRGELILIEL